MTLLQILQEFCARTGLPKPSIAVTSQDDQILQLVGLANEICEDLLRRGYAWTDLQFEASFTSVPGPSQGPVTALAPNAFLRILNDTIFNRTTGLPLYGPKSPQSWQAQRALNYTGPFYQYRIQRGELLTMPDMPAGQDLAFEYLSEGCVADRTNPVPVYKTFFTLDTDEFLLDKSLLLLGLRWRWKEEKGLPYLESFRLYEATLANAQGSDGTKPVISMNGGSMAMSPGIVVPSGNWNLP